MFKAERTFTLTIAILCLGYMFFAWKMDDFGGITEPGAAFFPIVLGLFGFVVSIKLFINTLHNKTEDKSASMPQEGTRRFGLCVVSSLLFIPLFEYLGAIIAIFALILAQTKILGAKGWVRPFILASVSSVVAYLLFYIVLEVPLPRGIL